MCYLGKPIQIQTYIYIHGNGTVSIKTSLAFRMMVFKMFINTNASLHMNTRYTCTSYWK